jgi:hypothetical protein
MSNIFDLSASSNGYNKDDRIRSISLNAIQETRIAIGRGGLPFLDDDARKQEIVYKILKSLTPAPDEIPSQNVDEHFPLVSKDQAPINPVLDRMSELLDNLSNEIAEEVDKSPIKASLPKAKQTA